MNPICKLKAHIRARISCSRLQDFTAIKFGKHGYTVYFHSEDYGFGEYDYPHTDDVGEQHCQWCAMRDAMDLMQRYGVSGSTKTPPNNPWCRLFGRFFVV